MSDVWQAEVMVAAVTYSGPTSGILSGSVPFIAYGFSAIDPSGFYPSIYLQIREDPGHSGNLQVYEQHGFASGGDPMSPIAGFASFTAAPGTLTSFLSGGLIKIVKDEAAAEFQYTGILGTSTKSFASLGGIPDGEMAPLAMGLGDDTVFTGTLVSPTANATTLAVPFDNFWGSKNGTHIKGADLGSSDRGAWVAHTGPPAPWDVINTNATLTEPSTATDIVGQIVCPATPTAHAKMVRYWDESVYLITAGSATLLDLAHSREHGALWADYVIGTSPDTVKWRRSFNRAANWEDGTLYTAGGTMNTSLNINWTENKVVAVWYTGTAIVQAVSFDLGSNWEAPVALSITGTNPRHVVDLAHGMSFYFYCAGGNLMLQRSGTLGASFVDASPITVLPSFTPQTVAAQVTSDHRIVVGYIAAGVWSQVVSTDYGLTFS